MCVCVCVCVCVSVSGWLPSFDGVLAGAQASSEGELTIRKGDEILITEEDDSGWWKVRV